MWFPLVWTPNSIFHLQPVLKVHWGHRQVTVGQTEHWTDTFVLSSVTSLTYLGCRRCDFLQVSKAAVFVTDEASPQHRATAGRTFALHWQEVGRLWPQKVFGKADHMTAHLTGWEETAQLFWHLTERRDKNMKRQSFQLTKHQVSSD